MEISDEQISFKIEQIAQKIKQLRKDSGYTSYETFAYDKNLNRVQYWRIEKGHNITLKTLIKVLDIHKMSMEDFFKGL
jgi:transcriptional regulator with XRE-family HTH domain